MFVVRKPSTGIATSANLIVQLKLEGVGVPYLPYPLSFWSVEGGAGYETTMAPMSTTVASH